MKRMKRIIAFLAVLALMAGCLGNAYAATPDPDSTLASPTLSSYAVWLDPGDYRGELDITFYVTATDKAESLGVSYFEVYRASDDKLIDKVLGTEENGLKSSGISYGYTYTYPYATPGVRYYVVVAVFAQINGTSHSRTLETPPVTTPTAPTH